MGSESDLHAIERLAMALMSFLRIDSKTRKPMVLGLRERFQAGRITGLADQRTISQLAQIRYRPNSRGQIVIESKEELLRRGVKSPDRVLLQARTGGGRPSGIGSHSARGRRRYHDFLAV
jgi:hypothetical protein